MKHQRGACSSVVRHDLYDERLFDEALEHNTSLQETWQRGRSMVDTFPSLLEDMYYAVFKAVVDLKPDDAVEARYKVHVPIVKAMMQGASWSRLKAHTTLDSVQSADVSAMLLNSFITQREEEMKAFGDASSQARDVEQDLQMLEMSLDAANTPVEKEFEQKRVDEANEKLSVLSEAMVKAGEAIENAAYRMAEIVDTTIAAIKIKNELFPGFSIADGNDGVTEGGSRMELAAKIASNDELRKIFDIMGRLYNLACVKQKTKQRHYFGSIANVILSDNLNMLLPLEFMQLADPDMELLFYIRYFQKQLSCYEVEERIPLGKGPVVACVDISGSMYDGDKEIWAKGLVLAMVQLAKHDHRDAIVVPFSSDVKREFVFTITPPTPQDQMVELASYSYGAGTNFRIPLTKALGHIRNYKQFKDADLVFITDGQAPLTLKFIDDFMKEKANLHFEMFSLVIGGYMPVGLKAISDQFLAVRTLDTDAAGLVFEAM